LVAPISRLSLRHASIRSRPSGNRVTAAILAGSVIAHGSRTSYPRRFTNGTSTESEKCRPASENPSGLAR